MEEQTDELKSLLISWNSEHVLDILKNENINIEVLKIINEEQVKELTQNWKIGDKAVFLHHLRKWRTDLDTLFSQYPTVLFSNSSQKENSAPSSPAMSFKGDLAANTDGTTNINVMNILTSSSLGTKILKEYNKNKYLPDDHRNLIIKIIVQYFQTNSIRMCLQTSYDLEEQILHIFHTEKLEFYRTERRGKIYMKFHNTRKTNKNVFNDLCDSPSTSKQAKYDLDPESNANACVESLKYDNLSAEEFNETWRACSRYRLRDIVNNTKNMAEIFEMWPQYKMQIGYKLVDFDFSVLYPSYESISTWTTKIPKLFRFLKQSKVIKPQTEERKILDSITDEDITKESQKCYLQTLWVSHYLLFPTGRYVKKTTAGTSEVRRYTISDSQFSFIYFGNTKQELLAHVEFLKNKMENIQPFILAIGTLVEFSELFIYLDGILIPFKSFNRTLDILFKMYHVFHLKYPNASENFWYFIQLYLYSIKSDEKISSKVSILLQDLSKI
ncbi:uncharacterized protein LOC142242486 [Haematobia irritans]|uniref:uncharacterized protein LOC142242486 n=1 Tax=Haematobia irritans TaxID=7368 RepID=UPI003F4F7635